MIKYYNPGALFSFFIVPLASGMSDYYTGEFVNSGYISGGNSFSPMVQQPELYKENEACLYFKPIQTK
jgi:hypothetical protein